MLNIITTTQAEHIAQKITNRNIKVFFVDKNKDGERCFPDGEVYVRLSKINKIKGRTIILHSGAPNPNQGIIELKSILSILNKAKIKPLEVFFTYFPYGMKDDVGKIEETCVAEDLIKELIEYYGVKKIYTIDAHFSKKKWLNKYPVQNIAIFERLSKEALKENPQLVFLAPDLGSQKRIGLTGVEKIRKNSYNVEIKSSSNFGKNVKNKSIAVVDDLLETGGTMEKFYRECKKYGANNISAVITHGVLKSGIKRIKKIYKKLYITNTINIPEANIDISDIIIKNIIIKKD